VKVGVRSIIGLSVRLWARQPWVKIPVGTRDFLLLKNAQCGSGTHPASSSVWFYPRVKWPSHEVKHTLLFSAEAKNEWHFTSAPSICLHGIDRKNFTLLLVLLWVMIEQKLENTTTHILAGVPLMHKCVFRTAKNSVGCCLSCCIIASCILSSDLKI
jgi:hypothetical protein